MMDNYDLWAIHDAKREAEREKLPRCVCCNETIMEDTCYVINDEVICEECLNTYFRKRIEDLI